MEVLERMNIEYIGGSKYVLEIVDDVIEKSDIFFMITRSKVCEYVL